MAGPTTSHCTGIVQCHAAAIQRPPSGPDHPRPEPEVRERLKQKVAESGVSSLSQYVADLLAIHVGMPELARELGQEVLQLPITAA